MSDTKRIYTDGNCGLSWDDSIITGMTPAPSARCPFEYFHEYENGECLPLDPSAIPEDYAVRPIVTLEGMTQQRWSAMTKAERDKLQDLSGLTPQLLGLEGWRVEVDTSYGETRRFIVGRSTGWKPCHLEIPRRDSSGGMAASKDYEKVTPLYQAHRDPRATHTHGMVR